MISTELKNRIGTITLARSEKRNALNDAMVDAILTQVIQFNQDPDCRVIWLRAEGNTFSAGADLAYLEQLRSNSLEENISDSKKLGSLFYHLYTSSKITISEVNGYALAGGCGLATICDYCLAGEDAHFGYTESKIGFVPALVMIFLLKKINPSAALDLMLSGKIINASDALQLNLISRVVTPSNHLQQSTQQFIQELIKSTSAQSIALIKEMRTQLLFGDHLWAAIEYAAQKNADARNSEDCIKGITAFLNKQQIEW
jgi:methylglutaconyl-CoA hydratase